MIAAFSFALVLGSADPATAIAQTPPDVAAVVQLPALKAPTVASNDYPEDTWGAPEHRPGVFLLTASGSTTAVGFAYMWGPSELFAVPSSENSLANLPPGWVLSANGTIKVSPPANLGSGPKTLSVRTFDNALNSSEATEYHFYISPLIPEAGPTRNEAELFKVAVKTGRNSAGKVYGAGSLVIKESQTGVSKGKRAYLLATGGSPAYGPEFRFAFETKVRAGYSISAAFFKAKNFGRIQVRVLDAKGDAIALDNNEISPKAYALDPFDGYAAKSGKSYQRLGGFVLDKGSYYLAVRVVGKNPASVNRTVNGVKDNGYSAAVDYFTIAPLNNRQVTTFQAALNNNGISSDGVSSANVGPSKGNSSLSGQALRKAGIGPGQTKTINGAKFTIPRANADGSDNLIATGQTIRVTPVSGAKYVDLLVFGTCGELPEGISASVSYSAETNSVNPLPDISSWSARPLSNSVDLTAESRYKVATLAYSNVGLKKATDRKPTIYQLKLKLLYAASSSLGIRIPPTGSDLTDSCGPALHVLAVSTSR